MRIVGHRIAGPGLRAPVAPTQPRVVKHPQVFEVSDQAEAIRKLRELKGSQRMCGWQWTTQDDSAQ